MTRATTRKRRQSAAVYRRRRLMLVIGVLALTGGIVWLLIAQPWLSFAAVWEAAVGDDETPSSSPSVTRTVTTPSASPTPSATKTPTPEATTPAPVGTAKPCVTSDILVEALSDADTYAAGVNPKLSIRLTNEGEADCTLNVGTTTQKFTVTSGDDVWWRSTDCQSEPSDMIATLAAGQTVSSATPVVWDRTRSSVSTCDTGNRPAAPGGGASYHVTVEIGGILSTSSKQILLY
ncbi:hypothetical protein ABZ477_10080 [Microbacterium sp. NPDC019599]|uniref:hypothetical protein n=1 Tax=Microbacterium sp. NPDC019599 TaxID=3154690 RepID=UPI0033E0E830